jgi:chemotaxis protein methyltransferase CheR
VTVSELQALSAAAGLDLDAYSERHVEKRVARALEREHLTATAALVRLVAADRTARDRFRRSIAVSVSGLFRDPEQFDILEHELLPPLLEGGRALRVWSAGCADGSELYSIALVLDRLGALDRSFLLGSDLLEENLELARLGRYGETEIDSDLRHRVRWERRDLVREGAPPGRWDLVLCRNVAIYLAPAAKQALHELLAASLAPGGVLLLGTSERLAEPARLGVERLAPHAYRKAA